MSLPYHEGGLVDGAMFSHLPYGDDPHIMETQMYKQRNPLLANYRATRPARPLFIACPDTLATKRRPLWPLLFGVYLVGSAIAGAFVVMACAQVLEHLA